MDISFERHIDTANLFLQDNALEKSIENYKEALALASTLEQKINLYNVLGKLYQKTKHPDKAITMFRTSIELYGDVSDHETLANKAAIYNNLGALYLESNVELSIKNYTSALKIYSNISNSGIKNYIPHLANTHFAMAESHLKSNEFYNAKTHFKEAIKLYNQLPDNDFNELKAKVYYQLGNIYTEEFNEHDAKVNYLKSLTLFEDLTSKDQQRFQPFLAAVYNNLGVTLKTMGDSKKAFEYYEKALEQYELLANNQNMLFLPYVAATYNSLGILNAEIKDFKKAIDYIHKTSTIYNNLVNDAPEEYTHYLATSLHNLGLFYFEIENVDKAEYYFNEALKMRKTLALHEPDAFNADVCVTTLNLIELYQNLMESSLDINFKTKCLELLTDLDIRLNKYNDERAVVKSMKSDCQYYKDYFSTVTLEVLKLNNVFKKVDHLTQDINSTQLPSEKIGFQQNIVTLLEDLNILYPDNDKLKNELAYAYNDLSWLQLRLKDLEKAESIIIKAQKLEQPILPLKCNLAHSYLLQNKFTEAKQLYLELKNEKNSENEPFAYTIFWDFKTLKEDGINHNDFEKIKKLLS